MTFLRARVAFYVLINSHSLQTVFNIFSLYLSILFESVIAGGRVGASSSPSCCFSCSILWEATMSTSQRKATCLRTAILTSRLTVIGCRSKRGWSGISKAGCGDSISTVMARLWNHVKSSQLYTHQRLERGPRPLT